MKQEEIEQYRSDLVRKYQLLIQEDKNAYLQHQQFLERIAEIDEIRRKIKALRQKIKEYEQRIKELQYDFMER